MDVTTILLSAISALFGGFIGTYFGAWFISKRGEKKAEKNQELAIKAMNLFKRYAKRKNTYKECISDFNNTFNIAEKRAMLVCLYKLGIPINLPIGTTFNIKNISFSDIQIDKEEIENMIKEIENGRCDHLFYMDVDKTFNENLQLNTIRQMGVKYIKNVLMNSKCDIEKRVIDSPEECFSDFTFSELKTLLVFSEQFKDKRLFKSNGEPDNDKLNQLIDDVKIGIWDNYLLWNYDAYQNLIAQKDMVNLLTRPVSPS